MKGNRFGFSDAVREPIVMTSAYIFDDPEQARARFAGEQPGNVYTRFTNPNVEELETRIAALESAPACVALSTGMACYAALLMEMTEPGDRVALSRGIFGSTTTLFESYGKRWGVDACEFDPAHGLDDLRELDSPPRLIILESPTNPTMELADIAAYAKTAGELGSLLVVDNTICGPHGQQPLKHGADLVVHSLAKIADGQGRAGGGAIAGSSQLIERLASFRRVCGPSLSPFNAWLLCASIETLQMRSNYLAASALALVDALESARIEVLHPWARSCARPDLKLTQILLPPGVVSFRLGGGRERAWEFLTRLRRVGLGTNIGDGRTLATHPATTTHVKLHPDQRARAGITEDLVRISLGLEPSAAVVSDVLQALGTGPRRGELAAP